VTQLGLKLTAADHKRLGAQLVKVRDYMLKSSWRTLRQISDATGAPEASVSARLRDLRHMGFSVKTVRAREGGALYLYRVEAP